MRMMNIFRILLLTLAPITFVNADDSQSTNGDQSPAIKAGRDVKINYGASTEELIKIVVDAIAKERSSMEGWKTIDRYQVKGGLVKDTETGLMWMRCSLGQTWKGPDCIGKPADMTWEQASTAFKNFEYAGYNDWRLPKPDELKTFIHCGFSANLRSDPCVEDKKMPKIMSQVFPEGMGANRNGRDYFWWSSKNTIYCNDYACFVDERKGVKEPETYYVRFVR